MAKENKSAPVHEVHHAESGYEAAQDVVSGLQLEELVKLQDEVEKLIGQKQKEQQKVLYANMLEMAKAAGYSSVEEFIASRGGKSGRTPRSDKGVKLPPKYQNSDGSKTWSGKGRKPGWVVEHLEAGGALEALEIE